MGSAIGSRNLGPACPSQARTSTWSANGNYPAFACGNPLDPTRPQRPAAPPCSPGNFSIPEEMVFSDRSQGRQKSRKSKKQFGSLPHLGRLRKAPPRCAGPRGPAGPKTKENTGLERSSVAILAQSTSSALRDCGPLGSGLLRHVSFQRPPCAFCTPRRLAS